MMWESRVGETADLEAVLWRRELRQSTAPSAGEGIK